MEIKEIADKNIWETFIKTNSPQSLFQSWNWGEVVKKSQSVKIQTQNLWRLGIYDKEHLIGIAQVNKVVAKRGNFFHVRHGPIFKSWHKKYFKYFLEYLNNLSREEKAILIRISPLIDDTLGNQNTIKTYRFINAPIHAMDGEYCWIINLRQSEEAILASMRKTTRYLIKQAQKLGVEIVKSKNKNDLEEFLLLYRQTAMRQNFIAHKGIMEEFEQFLQDDQILLFKGYYQKKLISSALIIFYNNQAIYHHSASIEQKIPVNYLLQWEVIKEAKNRKMDYYNMWGVAPVNKIHHPWRGLTIFKQGFGGEIKEYLHAQDLPVSYLYYATYVWEWIRKIKRGY
ncbi:peptidoglycan bridge formation glycyltransferase FemA/FemB family protein [Candidatus Gottesmanbacteria bacterium]|nr:peptidoglycan bridge formation glycyltransferase FemA/FemB family protein [Candidatus Gottesmanbacteria bacterium]